MSIHPEKIFFSVRTVSSRAGIYLGSSQYWNAVPLNGRTLSINGA